MQPSCNATGHFPHIPALSTQVLLIGALVLCLATASGQAQARSKAAQTQTGIEHNTTAKKKSVKVKQQRSPAEESKAERDRRLYRECQGRHNAGACLGYTRAP